MKGYFKVLESVDLGSDVNPIVYMYHEIWNKINSNNVDYNQSCWNPETETERNIIRGFKANYPETEMNVVICLDLNSVEVEDVYCVASDFEEFAMNRLKPYFEHAYPMFLEQQKSKKTA